MSIKVYYSDQAGAPTLNGAAGSFIAVLDACLINGYNSLSVTSITRAANIVTVQTATAHGYTSEQDNYWSKPGVGNIATISGATETDYNGEWPVTVLSSTTFTFDIGSATPTTPATGTITTKRAPAGFSKSFNDTNRAAYRSNDITSRRFYLYVNDTGDCANGFGARYAWWRGYEKMTSIDTGEGLFPQIQQSGAQGQYVCKSNALDSSSRKWALISDGKSFFLVLHPDIGSPSASVSSNSSSYWFGDYIPTSPDGYAVLISGHPSSHTGHGSTTNSGMFAPSGSTTGGVGWDCIARKYNGQQTPAFPSGKIGHGMAQACFGYAGYLNYPDPFGNRMFAAQIKVFEPYIIRGTLPLYDGVHGRVHSDREIIGNIVGREDRNFICLLGTPSNASYLGSIYVDVTGNSNGKWS